MHHSWVKLLPDRAWPYPWRTGAALDGFVRLAVTSQPCLGGQRWGRAHTLPQLLWGFQPAELSLSIQLSALSCFCMARGEDGGITAQ